VTSLRDVLLEPIAAFIRRVDEFDEALGAVPHR
jgi:hypothetical protein